jgi:hypothetical protein
VLKKPIPPPGAGRTSAGWTPHDLAATLRDAAR